MSASTTKPARMTSDEFIAWSMSRSDGKRFELWNGEVYAMASERVSHALMKGRVYRALHDAVRSAKLGCTAFPDGMAVEIDEFTVYEPDALVRCGPALDPNTVKLVDPVVVVEVLSPSTSSLDLAGKLDGYFRVPSIQHYLIVRVEERIVLHHRRSDGGMILTEIIKQGSVRLDPPGLVAEGLFDPLD